MNQSSNYYDLIIIGGGCTGLAIARELLLQGDSRRVLVLEGRIDYSNDRTWCYWADKKSFWHDFAAKTWHQWYYSLFNEKSVSNHHSHQYSYCYLPAIKYYEYHVGLIKQSSTIELFLNSQVKETSGIAKRENSNDNYWTIRTDRDLVFYGKNIIDTRPPRCFKSLLYQSFYGVEIETSSIDIETVALMSQMRTDQYSFRFNYILPLGDKKYLFEHTRFTPNNISLDILEKECLQEMMRLKIDYKEIIRFEAATLPMGLRVDRSPWPQAGTVAGGLRDSSGYGFLRLQKWAREYVSLLTKDNLETLPRYGSSIDAMMDKIFIRALLDNQSRIPDFFIQLSKNCDYHSLIRFLSDDAFYLDYLRVMKSLPPKPFIKSLYKVLQDGGH